MQMVINRLKNNLIKYNNSQVSAATIAAFRILFGLLMAVSILRFWSKGWIEKFYIEPNFFFSYYGFEWVKPMGNYTYIKFVICLVSSVMVALGYKYRLAMISFFLSFLYIELMDKTTYLNHYYVVSSLSFLMIFLPANRYFSIDAYQNSKFRLSTIPKWNLDALKLLVTIVYFYAGLAKLNSDWLFEALPLKIWLPSKEYIPVIGNLLTQEWCAYFFSWFGAVYDLTIPFFLWYKPTRVLAFVTVVAFHLLTKVLFPIGMFPYIMILSATLFFGVAYHKVFIEWIKKTLKLRNIEFQERKEPKELSKNTLIKMLFLFFFSFQLLFPFRYVLYPGELFWTEEGYRFSWRVMLIEKTGYAHFKVVNSKTGSYFYVNNNDFLTSFQEKQMATQPDFIVAYAHYLKEHFARQGHKNIAIYVDSYVSLNGRGSMPYINPNTDLTKVNDSWAHKNWILPFKDEIKGI
jgi:hypothetical protein